MKKKTLTSGNIIIVLLSAVILVIGILFTVKNYNKFSHDYIYNRARVLVNNDLSKLETESNSYPELDYPYMFINLEGKVTYSDKNFDYKINDNVNMNELLQFDKSFYKKNSSSEKVSFVVNDNNKAKGFVIFLIPKEKITGESELQMIFKIFSPIILSCGFVIFILCIRILYLHFHIIRPVYEINKSSKAIIEGNYSIPVVKASGRKLMASEVDELSYNFELMRDELIDRQNREEELKRQQKELISCISHDLKTPVSTIKACSEALRDGIVTSEEKRVKYAATIVKKSDVLTNMMNDLLDYSNAELRELAMVKEDCYFKDYFEDIIKELEIFASHEGVILEAKDMIPNVLVNMDQKRISQVLYNLVENASKYMDKDIKKIIISGKFDRETKMIQIHVKDNGRGISMTDIPYVFDKFYRAEKSRTMRIPGSGLGLAICKYIVEEHGGEITCNSELNKGTEFVFTIKAL